MERLTKWGCTISGNPTGNAICSICTHINDVPTFDCGNCEHCQKMVNRLAAYEDSGLAPEEVEELKGDCIGDKYKTMTKDEVESMVGESVYIEDLTCISIPRQFVPASIFSWRYKDPFADDPNYKDDTIQSVTAVQPSALAKYTKYWPIEEYGKTWQAFWNNPELAVEADENH